MEKYCFFGIHPLLVALTLWGGEFVDKKVTFHVDSMTVVHVANKQSMPDTQVMKLFRAFICGCLWRNIVFRSRHVPGLQNDIADALSRSQW